MLQGELLHEMNLEGSRSITHPNESNFQQLLKIDPFEEGIVLII